jgi:hypothetical protein
MLCRELENCEYSEKLECIFLRRRFQRRTSSHCHVNQRECTHHTTVHCKEILVYIFPEKELRGLGPNFHIHVSVSDLYIPTIGPPFFPAAE